jgi:hypothetical protein
MGAEITRSARTNRRGNLRRGSDCVANNFQGRASAHPLITVHEQTLLNIGVAIADDFVHVAHVSETTATPAGGKASRETKNAGDQYPWAESARERSQNWLRHRG